MNQKSAIIIGAGPAGLTAALELIEMKFTGGRSKKSKRRKQTKYR